MLAQAQRHMKPSNNSIATVETTQQCVKMSKCEPSTDEMRTILELCQDGAWFRVFPLLLDNPLIALTPMRLNSRGTQTTTLLHQAITSKAGDAKSRELLIGKILELAPAAAAIRNTAGLLPLECLGQRDIKFESRVKKSLRSALVKAHPMMDEEASPPRRAGKCVNASVPKGKKVIKAKSSTVKKASPRVSRRTSSLHSKRQLHHDDQSIHAGATILFNFVRCVSPLTSLDDEVSHKVHSLLQV